VEAGARSAVCASTGNTSASAAAYCAVAGVACNVVVPEGKVALGKLAQAVAHGRASSCCAEISTQPWRASGKSRPGVDRAPDSVNPHRIEGQKTAAFEIAEELGRVPDAVALPVGNAGNISAYWRGFCELGGQRPVMLGFPGIGRRAAGVGGAGPPAGDGGHRHPHRESCLLEDALAAQRESEACSRP